MDITSGETQHGVDGADHALELFLLVRELLASRCRERVEACAPIVLRRSPLGAHMTVEEQTLQRGVERALSNLQDVARDLTQALRDAVPVHSAAGQRAEDEEI